MLTSYNKIDDLEKDWTWSKTFDFIFCRITTGSFADDFNMVENAFKSALTLSLVSYRVQSLTADSI